MQRLLHGPLAGFHFSWTVLHLQISPATKLPNLGNACVLFSGFATNTLVFKLLFTLGILFTMDWVENNCHYKGLNGFCECSNCHALVVVEWLAKSSLILLSV